MKTITITTQLAAALRRCRVRLDSIAGGDISDPCGTADAARRDADEALAAYDSRKPEPPSLAAALQNLAETVAEICPTLDADVQSEARDALAAYDAQQAQSLTPERIARALDYAHNDPDDKPAPAGDHTPEPWAAYDLDGSTPYIGNKAANGRPGWDHETIADLFRDMDDGTSVVGAMDEPYPNAAANARRIVACVNACAGIPTEALERDTVREIIRNVYEA